MSCINCGSSMIGDGYTSANRCEFASDTEYLTPDSGTIYCTDPETLFHYLNT